MTTSVLFVCDDNSILGPMAEAFVKRHGWSVFTAYSAGIVAKPVHQYTYRVMEEISYDLYGLVAKSIFEFNHLQHVDFLITLSDVVNDQYVFNESHIGTRLHWSFRSPVCEPAGPTELAVDEISLFRSLWMDADHWISHSETQQATQKKKKLAAQPGADMKRSNLSQSQDIGDVVKRFRRTRDEMEVQVMNWLEEEGVGPLWWRR